MQLLINEKKYKETLRNVLTEEVLMKSEPNKVITEDNEKEETKSKKNENFDLDCNNIKIWILR